MPSSSVRFALHGSERNCHKTRQQSGIDVEEWFGRTSRGANRLNCVKDRGENGMTVEAFRARPDDETWRESLQARRKGKKKNSKLKEKAKIR